MFNPFLVHYILNHHLQQYGPFKITYNTRKDKWSINQPLIMCAQEEGRKIIDLGESASMKASALLTKQLKNQKKVKPKRKVNITKS